MELEYLYAIYFSLTLVLTLDYSHASVPIPAFLDLLLLFLFLEWPSILLSFDPNPNNFDQIKFHILHQVFLVHANFCFCDFLSYFICDTRSLI